MKSKGELYYLVGLCPISLCHALWKSGLLGMWLDQGQASAQVCILGSEQPLDAHMGQKESLLDSDMLLRPVAASAPWLGLFAQPHAHRRKQS